jgi:hypothetical protein
MRSILLKLRFQVNSNPALRHTFNNLRMARSLGNQFLCCQLISESHFRDFRVCFAELIRDHRSIDIHRGPDVRVSHQLLLHGYRRPHSVNHER